MRRSATLLAAALGLGARAMLIPAGISPSGGVDSNSVVAPFPPLNPKSQTIQVPCSSCLFESENVTPDPLEDSDDLSSTDGRKNSLVLEFTISEDGRRLLLNNGTLYPLHISQAEAIPHLYVPQIPWSASVEAYWSQEIQSVPVEVTGSVIGVAEQTASKDGDMVVSLTYGIAELEHQQVTMDSISVKMLQRDDGELLILGLVNNPNFRHRPSFPSTAASLVGIQELKHIVAEAPFPESQHVESQECNALCRFKAMVQSKVKGLKHGKYSNCAGAKLVMLNGQLPTHIRPHFLRPSPEDGIGRHLGRPHHDGSDGPHYHHAHHHRHHLHHHRHRRHGFIHAFMSGSAAILIPTLAGVAVGMAVGVIGLGMGHLITCLWIKLVRGGRRGYASVSQAEFDAKQDLKADGDFEPLPVYEEAPTYEEATAHPK